LKSNLGCCNAKGEFLPPYILFKAEHLYDSWCENGPKGARYQVSSSGWMDQSIFFDWFSTLFVPRVEQLEGHKLLFLDGHASHISIPVIQLAIEKKIDIICLPPHSSHVLQSLDVGVF